MKKAIFALIFLALVCGCGATAAQKKELEQLLVIRTLAVDSAPDGFAVFACAKADDEGEHIVLSAQGGTVPAALERLREGAMQEELFFRHTGHVLVGERTARDGISPLLEFVCGSPELRLTVPLVTVRGAEAGELLQNAGSESASPADVLDALISELERRGASVFTAADAADALASRGSALLLAVRPQETAEGELTAAFDGYGVVKGSAVCEFIPAELEAGLGLMLGRVPVSRVELRDMYGAAASAEVIGGSVSVKGEYEGSELVGIVIDASVTASAVQTKGSGTLSSAGYAEFLENGLEKALAGQIGELAALSQELNADFLALSRRLEQDSPGQYRRMARDFSQCFPSVRVSVSVSARVA